MGHARAIGIGAWLLAVASCSSSHRIDDGVPDAMGDQSVFDAIDVAVEVVDYDVATEGEPLELLLSSRVSINGGLSDGRVPGLRIFGGEQELNEVGSAGAPQQFSFTYSPADSSASRMVLEFRYEGSSFALGVEPLAATFTSPAQGETVVVDDALLVRWSGIEAMPELFGISGGDCEGFTEVSVAETSATFTRSEGTAEQPCDVELTATWRAEAEPVAGTPFRSFEITGRSRRIHRFRIAGP